MNILIKVSILISLLSCAAQGAHRLAAGTFVSYFNKIQINKDGATKKFELTPYFSYGQQFHISGPHYFVPELGFAYFQSMPRKTHKRILFFHYDFSYILSQNFVLRYGWTTYRETVGGEGGTVTLRNGEFYSEFTVPSKERTSFYTTLDLGVEHFFSQANSARLDLHIMNARDLEDRAYNYLLTYNWYL